MGTVVTISEKNCHRKLRICVLKKVIANKIRLQDAFHLENNEIVTFKTSCRPDFEDEYVLIFGWDVFASPFATSNNSQVLCIFDIFDMNKIFYRCSETKTSEKCECHIRVAEVNICLDRDMVLDI